MSRRGICLLALLLALGSVIVANAALEEMLDLPDVRSGYPIIPTPSPTRTPDTPSSLLNIGVCITEIEFAPFNTPLERVHPPGEPLVERNRRHGVTGDLAIPKQQSDASFEFTLGTDDIVVIWTKSGGNDFDELFMNRERGILE